MHIDLLQLNWFAITIASAAYFILGALWFTPLFGKAYDAGIGVKRDRHQKWPMIYYVGPFVCAVVVTVAAAILLQALSLNQLSDAVLFGFVAGTGFCLSVSVNNAINPKIPRPLLYGLVTGSYHIVGLMIVSIILFLMHA